MCLLIIISLRKLWWLSGYIEVMPHNPTAAPGSILGKAWMFALSMIIRLDLSLSSVIAILLACKQQVQFTPLAFFKHP